MEITSSDHKFHFTGKGSKLFGIVIVNLLLTIITLGFYYPWAKAALLQYLYKETQLAGSAFTFHGTGKEMFKGFIRAILIFGALYGIVFLCTHYQMPFLGLAILYLGFFILIPFIIHGSIKYRLSRSSWRGIHFGYRGKLKVLSKKLYLNLFLTIITFGIYGAWLTINLRKYTISNIRYGDVSFKYKGEGAQLFGIILAGYLLSLVTLGIYSFWWYKDLYNYFITNITLHQKRKEIPVKSSIDGVGLLKLMIGNIIIIVFSLGIAYPWAQVRSMKYFCNNIFVGKGLDPDAVNQTEKQFKDATGEDLGDMLDMDLSII